MNRADPGPVFEGTQNRTCRIVAGVGDVLAAGGEQREEVTDVFQVVQVHDLVPASRPHRQQRPCTGVCPAAYGYVRFRVRMT